MTTTPINTFVRTYTYTDNRKGEIVFQVKANYISQADEAYQAKFGIDVRSQAWVGCKQEWTGSHGDPNIPSVEWTDE